MITFLLKRIYFIFGRFYFFVLGLAVLFPAVIFSQQKPDSLLLLIKNQKQDTLKAINLDAIGDFYNIHNKPDSAMLYYEKSFTLSEKLSYQKGIGNSAFGLGGIYNGKSKNDRALFYYSKSLVARQLINDKHGLSDCYKNIGIVYQNQSNFPKSFDNYFKSLRINTELKDTKGMSDDYFNIASIYDEQKEYANSLEYYFRALTIYKVKNDSIDLSSAYLNIGLVYLHQQNYLKAVEYYFKSLEIAEAMNDKSTMSMCYFNIGSLYDDLGQFDNSLESYHKSLAIDQSLNDESGITKCYINIGALYDNQKNYSKSKTYYEKAKQLAFKTNDIRDLMEIYEGLANAEAYVGNYKQAYDYHVKFKDITDSIFNLENSKQLSDARTNFEVEKKEVELRAKQYQQEKIYNTEQVKKELEIKNQKLVRNGFIVGTILSLLLAFFAYRNLNQSRKANKVIALQKEQAEKQRQLIENKQKEIIESITYAKNLQTAILPSNEFLNKHIPENFILYRPKDIVAGDFYWAEKVEDLFFIAAADSTGHGVPGAMVSVVCSNALNRTIKEFNLKDTGKILDKTRELVLETFEKSTNDVKDGMDISLLCIDIKHKTILWSGANNPLWYVYNNALIEIKADKQSIGKTENPKPFTTHYLTYNDNTVFYLFTDGLADQFGGSQGKKFKYKQFSELLLKSDHLSLNEQSQLLNTTFDGWRGDLEQVDDVCVIGIKI